MFLSALYGIIIGFVALFSGIINLTNENLEQTYAYVDAISDIRMKNIIGFIFVSIIAFLFVYLFSFGIKKINIENRKISKRHFITVWTGLFVILMLSWLPWILSYYPGSILADSMTSIYEAMTGNYTNHHPVVYSFFIGVLLKIGIEFDLTANQSVFIYTIIQYILMGSVISYIAARCYKMGAQIVWILMMMLYYCVAPIFPAYAIIMWKDPMFSATLAVLAFTLFDAVNEIGVELRLKTIIKLIISSLLTVFLRNNGIYIIAVLLVLILAIYKRKKLYYTLALASVLTFSIIVTGPVYKRLGIVNQAEESFGVMIQQFAYTAIEEPESLDAVELSAVDGLFPLESYKDVYNALNVDSIKWNDKFNSELLSKNKFKFLNIWLYMIPRHFKSFFNAYCLQTVGFWHPYYQTSYGYADSYIIEPNIGIYNVDIFKGITGLDFKNTADKLRIKKVSSGLLFLIMLTCMFIYIIKAKILNAKTNYLWLILPALLCWITVMLATPVAFSLRYVYILALQLPIYLILPFKCD